MSGLICTRFRHPYREHHGDSGSGGIHDLDMDDDNTLKIAKAHSRLNCPFTITYLDTNRILMLGVNGL